MTLQKSLTINADDYIAIRRDIHAHPELSTVEARTADVIAHKLIGLGYDTRSSIGGHGVVGVLKRGTGRRIAVRADFDALPVQEETGLPWKSRRSGHMHACGHDGHTAILLAACAELASTDFYGTFIAIFQPAEEQGQGARAMLDDGLLDFADHDAVFGLHNVPGFPAGMLGFRGGPFWAAVDDVRIELQGFGGHGGRPHLARDPLVAGAQMVLALQTIISRNADPIEPAVITVGAFQAGTTNNVIPDTALILANVRTFTPETRSLVLRRIREVIEGVAGSFGMDVSLTFENGSPPVVNDTAMTRFAFDVALRLYGPEQVCENADLLSYSDDMSEFLNRRPGSYIILGNGEDGVPLHHPKYDFNDQALPRAAHFWRELVLAYLSQ